MTERRVTFDREQIREYAEASGDRNPIHVDDEAAKVARENDWTAAQAARYPGRLIAFCSFNPLKDYALAELKRCAGLPGLKRGIKLHFGNSDVQLDDPAHVQRYRCRRGDTQLHCCAHTRCP